MNNEEGLEVPQIDFGNTGEELEMDIRTRSNTLNIDSIPMNLEENNATLPVERLLEVEEPNDNEMNNGVIIAPSVVVSGGDKDGNYSIRMTPFIDHSSTSPHMFFGPIIRKTKPGLVIEIGRYTERTRDAAVAPAGSSEMIVFKSKVVSRRHAELSVDEEGKWYIQDVKSSSGTFINHIRLSPPNETSERVQLRDSDILQLGVDYRGGSEDVFRCVRVRVETNGSWRQVVNAFSKQAHAKVKGVLGTEEADRCAICLEAISQCQALFVSPCSHWWHYGCIRPLLARSYPQFACPNCKALCHLEMETDIEESLG